MAGIKAVIFDCDGVMFDTAEANRLYYNKVLNQFKKPPLSDEQFYKVHMFTVKQALEYLFPEMHSLDEVYHFMKDQGYYQFIPHMKMEPMLKTFLDALKAKGYVRAIATNRTDTMPAVLKAHGLSSGFDMVVTAADVEHAKPDPDQLLKIQAAYHLKSDEMMFVGDSQFDQMAAKKAGALFVAFRNKALEADYHCDSMEEVANILGINL